MPLTNKIPEGLDRISSEAAFEQKIHDFGIELEQHGIKCNIKGCGDQWCEIVSIQAMVRELLRDAFKAGAEAKEREVRELIDTQMLNIGQKHENLNGRERALIMQALSDLQSSLSKGEKKICRKCKNGGSETCLHSGYPEKL